MATKKGKKMTIKQSKEINEMSIKAKKGKKSGKIVKIVKKVLSKTQECDRINVTEKNGYETKGKVVNYPRRGVYRNRRDFVDDIFCREKDVYRYV